MPSMMKMCYPVHGCIFLEEGDPSMMRMCHLGKQVHHSLLRSSTLEAWCVIQERTRQPWSMVRHLGWWCDTLEEYALNLALLDVPSWCKDVTYGSLMTHCIPWWTNFVVMPSLMLMIVQGCSEVEDAQELLHDMSHWWLISHGHLDKVNMDHDDPWCLLLILMQYISRMNFP